MKKCLVKGRNVLIVENKNNLELRLIEGNFVKWRLIYYECNVIVTVRISLLNFYLSLSGNFNFRKGIIFSLRKKLRFLLNIQHIIIISMDAIFSLLFPFSKNLLEVLKKEFIAGWNNSGERESVHRKSMNNSSGQLISMADKSSWNSSPRGYNSAKTNRCRWSRRSSRATEKTQTHYFHHGGPSKGANSALKGRAGRLTRNLTSSTNKVITSFQRRLK